jgi:hypothetical protein
MQKNKQKKPLNQFISNNSVKKGYSSSGAIWSKPNASSNNLFNSMGTQNDVNSSTGIDDNSRFSLDPSGDTQ